MPIYNWFKIQKTNELTWCLISKRKVNVKQMEVLKGALQTMTDEYIDTFGISDTYRNVLQLKGEIVCLECDYIINKDISRLTFIQLAQQRLEKLLNENNSTDETKARIYASKYMGFPIDTKKISVKEFYEILKEASTNER